jgi:hypothetical protein
MLEAESTPLPCGPPAIQFTLSTTICASRLKIFLLTDYPPPVALSLPIQHVHFAVSPQ